MAAQHTPGPWAEFCESGEWWIGQAQADGSPTPGGFVCDSVDIRAPDGALICAAPDLLAACEQAIAEQSLGVYGAISNECIAQLRVAIAKAYGQ